MNQGLQLLVVLAFVAGLSSCKEKVGGQAGRSAVDGGYSDDFGSRKRLSSSLSSRGGSGANTSTGVTSDTIKLERLRLERLSDVELVEVIRNAGPNPSPEDAWKIGLAIYVGISRNPGEFNRFFEKVSPMLFLNMGYEVSGLFITSQKDLVLGKIRKFSGNNPYEGGMINTVWVRLAGENIDDAVMLALREKSAMAVTIIASLMAATDPRKAIDVAGSLTDPVMRSEALSSAAQKIALTDPALAFEILGPLVNRSKAMALVFDQWFIPNPDQAYSSLSSLSKTDQIEILGKSKMLAWMASSRPEDLESLLDSEVISRSNFELYAQLYSKRTDESIEETFKKITDYPEGTLRNELMAKVMADRAASDVDTAISMANSATGESAEALYVGLGKSFAMLSVESRMQLLESASTDARKSLLSGFLSGSSDPSALELVNQIASNSVSEKDVDSVLSKELVSFGKRIADRGQEGLEGLNGVQRYVAAPLARGYFAGWAVRDPNGVATWLRANENDQNYQIGVHALVRELDVIDPEMADQWRKSLSQQSNGQN